MCADRGDGELPTRFGDFHIVAFENNRDGKEHVAITRGDVIGAADVPVRLHSECLTGDVMGSCAVTAAINWKLR